MSNKLLLFSKLLVFYTWQWTLVDELWTVFHSDGIPVRRWRTAWRTACQAAGVPTRFLHDCRRTAARNLIRANVPERVAMLLTGHKSRAIFDRYNIIHEQELLVAGDQLVAYLAQQAPARRRPHTVSPGAPLRIGSDVIALSLLSIYAKGPFQAPRDMICQVVQARHAVTRRSSVIYPL